MHPPELRERVQALRAEGLLCREIAKRTGVPKATVIRWLNPGFETRERAKAQKRKFKKRRKCPSCGKRMSNPARLCLACYKASQRQWTRERLVGAVKSWAAEHGYAPRHQDWTRGGDDHPAISSILDGPNPVFHSWSELLLAAGFTPGKRRGGVRLTREQRATLRRERREALLKKALEKEA